MCKFHLETLSDWGAYKHSYERGIDDIENERSLMTKAIKAVLDKFKAIKSQDRIITADQFPPETNTLANHIEKFYNFIVELNNKDSKVNFESQRYLELA